MSEFGGYESAFEPGRLEAESILAEADAQAKPQSHLDIYALDKQIREDDLGRLMTPVEEEDFYRFWASAERESDAA